jgi:PEP-CTERM motif
MGLKSLSLLLGLVLLSPGLATSTAVSLNGTCEAGNCTSPDVLNAGQSTGGALGLVYTFADGDKYYVSGTYGGSYNGGTIGYAGNPTATYLGNTSNPSAASQADVLKFDFLQNFNFTTGSPDGYYFYYFISDTSGPIASTSTYTGDLSINGQKVGAITVGTGYSGTKGFNQANFTGLTNPLMTDLILTLSFGAGSGVGATIATVTPEPSSFLLLSLGALGVLGIGLMKARRKVAVE